MLVRMETTRRRFDIFFFKFKTIILHVSSFFYSQRANIPVVLSDSISFFISNFVSFKHKAKIQTDTPRNN
jgi:hypothetical protein